MFRRVIVWLLAVFVIGQCFWFLTPTVAAQTKDLNFRADKDVISLKRIDEQTISGTFFMEPNNGWRVTAASKTVRFFFKKGEKVAYADDVREWKLDSATPSRIDLVKDSTNESWFFDYSGKDTSSDQRICFTVQEGGIDDGRALMYKKAANEDCLKNLPTRVGPSDNTTPLWALGYSINKTITKVENYNGDFGDSLGKDTVAGWFGYKDGQQPKDIAGLRLTISNGKKELPYVLVPKEKLIGAPGDLKFKLLAYRGIKGNLIENMDWFVFQATVNSKPIEGLYFGLTDNKDMNFYFVTDLTAFKNHDVSPAVATEIARANESSLLPDLHELLGKISNYPTGSGTDSDGNQNCGQGVLVQKKVEETGPKEFKNNARETLLNAEIDGEKLDGDFIRTMNTNCTNISATGWLQYWGVTDLVVDKSIDEEILGDGCSAGKLFASFTTKGIGEVFADMTDCLVKEIFTPAVNWAADLVVKAAGITYHSPLNNALTKIAANSQVKERLWGA